MRQLKITFLLTVLICMIGAKAFAHDIAVMSPSGVIIYYSWRYDVNGKELKELAVTHQSSYLRPANSYSGNVVIPESVDYNNKKYPVIGIGMSAFINCDNLTSVTIPNSVSSIYEGAFCNCPALTSIKVNSGNRVYDSRDNCNAVIESSTNKLVVGCNGTVIPNSVIEIGRKAFGGCTTGMTSITIPNSVATIGIEAFANCSALTTVNFGNGLKTIEGWAFDSCTSLTAISFPNSMTTIGDAAFQGCTSLTAISFPNSLTTIGDAAFADCTNLESVIVPNSVSTIGGEAFIGTAWYENQPEGLIYLGKVAYDYKGTMPEGTEMVLKDGTLGITSSAFPGCKGLTSITIPKSVVSIGEMPFALCSSLTSIIVEEGNTIYDSRNNCNAIIETLSNTLIAGCQNTIIPNGVTSIAKGAFDGCVRWFTPLTIPYGVTTIGVRAFSDCAFTSVDIPNSVTTIGDRAFENCQCIGSITIPNSVTEIGINAFWGCCRMTSLMIGKGVVSIGQGALTTKGYSREKLRDIYCYAEQVPDLSYSGWIPDESITLHVPATSLEAYKTAYEWKKFTNIVPLEEMEPLVSSRETTFGGEDDAINEETDLTDAFLDNIYYSMDQENGDGYDAESQALVLNSTNTEEQMSTVVEGKPGEDAVHDNYVGIIFELSSSSGMITIDLQTLGSNVLNIQVGKNKPKEFTQTDRGTITLRFNVGKPTYVYLYASSDKDHIASTRSAAENSVRLYGYKVDIDWSQLGDANGDWFINEEDIEKVSNYIMGKSSNIYSSGDANGDGKIDAADIVTIANLLK